MCGGGRGRRPCRSGQPPICGQRHGMREGASLLPQGLKYREIGKNKKNISLGFRRTNSVCQKPSHKHGAGNFCQRGRKKHQTRVHRDKKIPIVNRHLRPSVPLPKGPKYLRCGVCPSGRPRWRGEGRRGGACGAHDPNAGGGGGQRPSSAINARGAVKKAEGWRTRLGDP